MLSLSLFSVRHLDPLSHFRHYLEALDLILLMHRHHLFLYDALLYFFQLSNFYHLLQTELLHGNKVFYCLQHEYSLLTLYLLYYKGSMQVFQQLKIFLFYFFQKFRLYLQDFQNLQYCFFHMQTCYQSLTSLSSILHFSEMNLCELFEKYILLLDFQAH